MSKVFVVPTTGLKVRHPDKHYWHIIPASGEEAELTPQIQRLIRFGDLVVKAAPTPAAEKPIATPTATK